MLGYIPQNFPYNVVASRGARQSYLPPFDPQFYTRGEQGYYYDTPLGGPRLGFLEAVRAFKARVKARLGLGALGAIPTDFEVASGCQMPYTPVNSGWVATKEGYVTPPWPGTYNLTPPMQTPGWPAGMGDAVSTSDVMPMNTGIVPQGQSAASVEDVLAVMNAHNDRVFALAIVSTTAVAVSALLTVFRNLKLIKDDK